MASDSRLPEYDRPPVTEVALTVTFERAAEFGALDLAALAKRWEDILPRAEEEPLLPHMGYRSDDDFLEAMFGIEETANYPPRLWLQNDSGNQVVQIQYDRLVVNWLKGDDAKEDYPRYTKIRARLVDSWKRLIDACVELGSDEPVPHLCEVKYINHLGSEQGWSHPRDTERLIRVWSGLEEGSFLPQDHLSLFSFHCHFPEQRAGSLTIDGMCSGDPEGETSMELCLTARGYALEEDFDSALDFMDYGRRWIVEGFTDITTETAHEIWGRTR